MKALRVIGVASTALVGVVSTAVVTAFNRRLDEVEGWTTFWWITKGEELVIENNDVDIDPRAALDRSNEAEELLYDLARRLFLEITVEGAVMRLPWPQARMHVYDVVSAAWESMEINHPSPAPRLHELGIDVDTFAVDLEQQFSPKSVRG